MKLNPLSLSFSGDQGFLEHLFRSDYYRKYLNHFRVCHFFSIFFFGTFAIVDSFLFPDQLKILLFIRFGIVIPIFLLGFAITFFPVYEKIWPVINNFYVVLTGCGFFSVMVICGPPLSFSYYAGVIICIFFGYTYIRSRFVMASIAGCILLAVYPLMTQFTEIPRAVVVVQSSFLVFGNIIGMLICYSTEIAARNDFYLRYLLEQERENVEKINRNLEKLVLERTEKLASSLEQLREEQLERQNLESRLLQAQKMEAIGTLAGGIAHDFNNILSAIIGYSELAKVRLSVGNEGIKNDLSKVLAAAERAKQLVYQILAFSRKSDKELRPLRVQSILKEAIKLLRSTIPATIEIRTDIDENCPPVLADPTELHQIIMNICTNAYHAMQEKGGILQIQLCPYISENGILVEQYVHLSISDTGCGIPKEAMDRIFEPYFTMKEVGKGTGLGLAVVHGIIKSYGGRIKVTSEVGEGSTFDIYLLQSEIVSEKAAEDHNIMPEVRGNERILFVDDDKALADLNSRALKRFGYQVTAKTSSQEALALFRENPDTFDILVTDMTMPAMTGAELASQVLSIRPGFPIILCTGYSDIVDEDSAKNLGVRTYLTKPVTINQLAQAIHSVLNLNEEPVA